MRSDSVLKTFHFCLLSFNVNLFRTLNHSSVLIYFILPTERYDKLLFYLKVLELVNRCRMNQQDKPQIMYDRRMDVNKNDSEALLSVRGTTLVLGVVGRGFVNGISDSRHFS